MKISFYADIPGLHLSSPIQKSSFHIPQWFKGVKTTTDDLSPATIRTCPGFIDYFKQGYVVSLWCDLRVNIQNKGGKLSYDLNTTEPRYTFSVHGHQQFLQHVPEHVSKKTKLILKLDSPWKIVTPKGYSVLQLPMYYNYNENFEVLPGVIHTDVYHTINQQMCIFREGEFIIKKGTPLATYIPYKREELTLEMTNDEKIKYKIDTQDNIINSKFKSRFQDLVKLLKWKA